MQSMRNAKPGKFFSQADIKELLKINHNKTEVGDIIVYDFQTEDYKDNPYRNPLYHMNFFEAKSDINAYDERYIEYTSESDYVKGAGLYINSRHHESIIDLIQQLSLVDKSSALNMLDRYHNQFNESEEAKSTSNKIITETNLMMNYLRSNNIKVENLDFNLPYLNQFLDNRDKLSEELDKITNDLEPIEIEAYNDLDYYPYLFDDTYIIEDISASKMLICVKDLDKTYWHLVERGTNIEIDGWISEIMYEHHQLAKFSLETLDEFNLIAEFHGNKLVKSTVGIKYLNLLQGYIVEELVSENKLKLNLPDLSFEELLEHYAFQKEYYHIEERAIVPLLKKINVVDGKITYKGFGLVDPNLLDETIRTEPIGEHHFTDMEKIPNLDFLEPHHKESINKYLAELLERDNSKDTLQFVNAIQDKLTLPTTKYKPKLR